MKPPVMVCEVTRGVRIRATVLYAPEVGVSSRHTFAAVCFIATLCFDPRPLQPTSSASDVDLCMLQADLLFSAQVGVGSRHTLPGMFTYSIRFSLLPEDEQRVHWPATAGPYRMLTSVQLHTRHW